MYKYIFGLPSNYKDDEKYGVLDIEFKTSSLFPAVTI